MASVAAEVQVQPAVIVGGGRIGEALVALGDGKDVLVRRGGVVPEEGSGPIIVCTRNDDLDAVVEATPPSRRKDLVFLQNGMLEPWLASKGLSDATQVLAYFAVAKKGEAPIDGKTDMNPEGLTAANGKWADQVAARLASGGLSCKVLDKVAFEKAMLEKLIWISAYMVVGAANGGVTVGTVESQHRAQVDDVIRELAAAATAERGVAFDPQLEERMAAYSRSVAHFPTAVKEFKWRNGYFYDITLRETAAGRSDPLPVHTSALKAAKAV